jgi:hypothetical protein
MDTAYLPSGGPSSVGAFLIDRSLRFFDTACSRKDDFDFVSRRLLEKLPVCDLLAFRLNILDRFKYRDSVQYSSQTWLSSESVVKVLSNSKILLICGCLAD